jgi:hypothetical protein
MAQKQLKSVAHSAIHLIYCKHLHAALGCRNESLQAVTIAKAEQGNMIVMQRNLHPSRFRNKNFVICRNSRLLITTSPTKRYSLMRTRQFIMKPATYLRYLELNQL